MGTLKKNQAEFSRKSSAEEAKNTQQAQKGCTKQKIKISHYQLSKYHLKKQNSLKTCRFLRKERQFATTYNH